MPLRLVAVSFDAHDPGGLAAFWAGVIGPGNNFLAGCGFLGNEFSVSPGRSSTGGQGQSGDTSLPGDAMSPQGDVSPE